MTRFTSSDERNATMDSLAREADWYSALAITALKAGNQPDGDRYLSRASSAANECFEIYYGV